MKYVSFDLETTGFNPYAGSTIFSYCVGHKDGHVEVFRIDTKSKQINKENIRRLQGLFNDITIEKICHHFKFELSFLKTAGIYIPSGTIWHDTMIMSQLLNNLTPSHALDRLAYDLCKYPRDLDVAVKQANKAYGNYQRIPVKLMTDYQVADGERTMILFETFFPHIEKDQKLYQDYLNEIELVKVTQRLEEYGIMFAREEADQLLRWLDLELEKIQDDGYRLLGEYVNLNSSDTIIRLLYRKYRYPIFEFTKNKKPSTEKDIILKLRDRFENPLFDMILKQRSYIKGYAMIKSYKDFANEEDIIHPSIKTNHARTGRQSSENPNMQNVSKEAALKNLFPVPARKCFCCRPGFVLFFVDYAGIEMRLIIDASGEPEMIDLLHDDGDPHTLAAEMFYGKRFKQASDKEKKVLRSAAKNAHFALSYGASLSKVAVTLGMPVNEAKAGYKNYRSRFPKIAGFTPTIAEVINRDGYIMTPFGRRLYIPADKAYSGSNYLIQGTAAGILKRAQVAVDRYCSKILNDDVRIVIPIHDEIVLEYKKVLWKRKKGILRKISRLMTDMPLIRVPLEVEWKMSNTTWDKAKEIDV